jgi:C-terminal processing protease CtpA/Prc
MTTNRGLTRQQSIEAWLDKVHPAVKNQLGASVRLSEFMAAFEKRGKLSKSDRLLLVDQALLLMEMNYVHLPLKRAIHAQDPIQRLRRLKLQIERTPASDLPGEMSFHYQMQKVFMSTRDIHTSYSLPDPFKKMTAYLPFVVEEYFEPGSRQPRFLASHVARGFRLPRSFKRGVEILYWNGVPIRRAVEVNGEARAGSNPDARFARGLDGLTIRPFNGSLPPDEEWVVVIYRSEDGRREFELKQHWLVFMSKPSSATRRPRGKGVTKVAMDTHKNAINHVKKVLFAPHTVAADKRHRSVAKKPVALARGAIKTPFPTKFRARPIRNRYGDFGYVRIFTFSCDDVDAFVGEFARLIKLLPRNGLIIDVRSNGGGTIDAGERSLQLLTSRRIHPAMFEFINTPLNLELCRYASEDWRAEFSPWEDKIGDAILAGATYSYGGSLTPEEECNNIGQVYSGPVVLITDALCYSTTDIFAAGFQDHEIGKILGTSGNTGAGGANVVRHKDLEESMSGYSNSPFKKLPKRMGMRVALRRCIRVGKNAGRPLEEFGVIPDERHFMTRTDLLDNNRDLILHAVEILTRSKQGEAS